MPLRALRAASLTMLCASLATPAQAQSVRGFTPGFGPSGTLVKIIGNGLDRVAAVDFGGVRATTVLHVSSLQLKASVPEGAVTGPIGLVDRDGVRTVTPAVFIVSPTVTPHPPLGLAMPTPNPASGHVTLSFSLSRFGRARLSVIDTRGRRVRLIAAGEFGPGAQVRAWDGRDDGGREIPSGIYILRLDAEGRTLARRIAWIE